jgi:hypothetical protein
MMTPRSARLTDDVLADIQGFITSGYGHLSHAAYLFVQFDAGQAQGWLGRLAPAITSARGRPTTPTGHRPGTVATGRVGRKTGDLQVFTWIRTSCATPCAGEIVHGPGGRGDILPPAD